MTAMETPNHADRRPPGRPRSFDRETALHQAMLLFWRHGYEATSVADLTAAMGVTAPSLYTAFGDKKRLFLEAVGRYTSGPVTAQGIIRDAATARDAAHALLRGSAVGLTGEATPPGCMLVSSATNCSLESADVQGALAAMRLANEAALRAKTQADIAAGVLPAESDATTLASLTMAVIQGMSAQARDGAGRDKLLALADAAMRAWPRDRRPRRAPKL